MAARENQGLQIALIVFVMLTIILIVTTFLFFQNYREEQTKNKTLDEASKKANTERDTAKQESNEYKALLAGGIPLADIKVGEGKDAAKDFEVHGKTLDDSKKHYRGLVEFLAAELQNANTRIAEAAAHANELDEKIKADDAGHKAAVAKYLETLEATKKDLEDQRKKFNDGRKEITSSSGAIADKFNSARKEFEDLSKKTAAEIADLKTENGKLKTLLKNINDEKLRLVGSAEAPDGKVTWVNQRSRTVWINLGSDDGLRRQTAFSVVDSDQSNPAEANRKGKIEVVRLVNAHLAEARIVEDNLSDPIMPGDQIFSPIWEPGRAEHFGLAGKMDIDGDGESDRQRIRDLIALNGGVIDEEVTDEGKKSGEMSINTKYLILGTAPEPGATTNGKSLLESYSAISGEAQTLGVKTININEFLDYMGFKPEERTVELGPKAKSTDFKPRLPDGVQRVAPGSKTPRDLRNPTPDSKKKAS
jgi:hypothetical protein